MDEDSELSDEEIRALLQPSSAETLQTPLKISLALPSLQLNSKQLASLQDNRFLEIACTIHTLAPVVVSGETPATATIVAQGNALTLLLQI